MITGVQAVVFKRGRRGGAGAVRAAPSDAAARQSMTPVRMSSRIVPTAEIMREPRQPLRFEKKSM